jgi:uncharacterized protein YjiK
MSPGVTASNNSKYCNQGSLFHKYYSIANLPFNLGKPDKLYKLDRELNEISGLTWQPQINRLLAVSDDNSHVFALEMNGNIDFCFDLSEINDFEAITTSSDRIIVMSSTGLLYDISFDWKEREIKSIIKYRSGLTTLQEPEGMCLSRSKNSLLIALKGKPGKNLYSVFGKAIYSLPVERFGKKAKKSFVFKIDDLMHSYPETKKKHREFAFSGCDIDPLTKDLYVISAVNEWLFVFDSDKGQLKHAERLSIEEFKQPEGICFDDDGDLYIASEGKSEKAILAVFRRK